jgi:two-component system sensor histidine kinase HydH
MRRKIGRIRGKLGGELLFTLLLIPLFLVLAVSLVFLARGERRNNRLLSQYEAQRAIIAMGEALRRGKNPMEMAGDNVLGLGSYDSEGNAIERWGSAPANVQIASTSAEDRPHSPQALKSFAFDRKKRTLVLIDRVGPPPHDRIGDRLSPPSDKMKEPSTQQEVRPPSQENRNFPAKFPAFVWVEISTEEYWKRQDLLAAGLIFLLLFVAALVVITQYGLRKSSKYRKRLREQEQLVHLGEAARTLSHEIKNPLSAIRLRTDILNKLTVPEGIQDLRIIQKEVDRLQLLADRIGDFLKNPRGDLEVLDIRSFVKELYERAGDGVTCEDLTSGPCYISFDRDRLRSVIENLVQNALESGSLREEVVLRLESTDARVRLSILDRGSGIPAEILDKIFDPFFTTKTHGSGIGLSIAKRFVEASGGMLKLSRREGGGTSTSIILRKVEK